MNTVTELIERLKIIIRTVKELEALVNADMADTRKTLCDAIRTIEELSASKNETHEDEKFTQEELSAIAHGISIKLLSLRSAQKWKADEKTADEILFLECLYRKLERMEKDHG